MVATNENILLTSKPSNYNSFKNSEKKVICSYLKKYIKVWIFNVVEFYFESFLNLTNIFNWENIVWKRVNLNPFWIIFIGLFWDIIFVKFQILIIFMEMIRRWFDKWWEYISVVVLRRQNNVSKIFLFFLLFLSIVEELCH